MNIFAAVVICAGSLTVGLGNWWVNYAVQRPVRSQQWHGEIDQRKTRLIHDYNAQSVSIPTSDGRTLSAYWIERPEASRAILMCHGHHMVKEHMIKFLDLFPHDSILMIDFRGHGQSSGKITTLGIDEKYDALAGLDFLQEKTSRSLPIVGFGFSMGGLPLIQAAVERPVFSGLILDGAFSNLETILAQACKHESRVIPCTLSLPLMRTFFKYCAGIDISRGNSAELLARVQVPVLIIHSHDDEVTNVGHAHALHEHAAEPKHIWLVHGSKHGYIVRDHMQEYKRVVENFCAQYACSRCAQS